MKFAWPLLMAVTLFAAQAAADEPKSSSCKLVSALIEKGGGGGTSHIVSLSFHWPQDDRAKLRAQIAPFLRRFEYAGGGVFRVADLGRFMQEHLIIMRTRTQGVVYFRIIYENYKNEFKFAHIGVQTVYKDISKTAYAQAPEELACS